MRICFCLNGPNEVNGPNVWLTRHLPLLRRLGAAPEVLYLTWHPRRRCRFRISLEQAGIPCRTVRPTRFIEDNVPAIVAALADDPPAVFVPNYTVPAYFAARFLRAAGVVTVGTLHSDDPYYMDILETFALGQRRWRLDALVGVSEFLRETVANENRRKPLPFLHAPYGAPVPKRKARPDPDRFGLVYAGRLVERQKRVRRVASAMIAATRADHRVHGVLLGDGPERTRIRALVRRSGVGDRILVAGAVPTEQIQTRMLAAHAFILLSDFEGLSIALMEAMACGLVPIVARMRSGVSDVVVDGANGFVVEPGDEDAFVDRVIRLADQPRLWRAMSRNARATIVDRGYTAEACARKWLQFLVPLVAERRVRPVRPLPHPDRWDLPPRSERPDGIQSEDRRNGRTVLLNKLAAGAPVYLWGAGGAGEAYLESIRDLDVRPTGFVDSDPAKRGRRLRGIPIHGPERLATALRRGLRPFVVITSQFEREISAALRKLGFVAEEDFIAG